MRKMLASLIEDFRPDIKENVNRLTQPHRHLYRNGAAKRLKDRVSSKFPRLVYSNNEIADEEIRDIVQRIRAAEQRMVAYPVAGPAPKPQPDDHREALVRQVTDSEHEEENVDPQVGGGGGTASQSDDQVQKDPENPVSRRAKRRSLDELRR